MVTFSVLFSFFILLTSLGYADWRASFDRALQALDAANNPRSVSSCSSIGAVTYSDQASQGLDWGKSGFANVKTEILDYRYLHSKEPPQPLKNEILLTAIVLRNSGWSAKEVKRRLKATAQIFEQCGINLVKVNLVEADAPERWINVEKLPTKEAQDGAFLEMSTSLPKVEKPLIIYFKNSGDGQTGYSAPDNSFKEESPLLNTIGISSKVLDSKYTSDRGREYVSEAHELGHLIGNWSRGFAYGHIADENNVMSGNGTKFNKDQCEEFQFSSLITNK